MKRSGWLTGTVGRVAGLMVLLWMVAGPAWSAGKKSEDWRWLTMPPVDSAEAKRVRIWLPIEHQNPCRVNVIIFGRRGDTVRWLLSQPLRLGYYNIYWDKRDDSGRFVRQGKYSYLVDDCGKTRYGQLEATYTNWERKLRVLNPPGDRSATTRLELLADSALVTVELRDAMDNVQARPIVDTLLNAGLHELVVRHSDEIPKGAYRLYVTVGDYTFRRLVRVR